MGKPKAKANSMKDTLMIIGDQLYDWEESPLAITLSNVIKSAREKVDDPLKADATELLTYFRPSGAELKAMGLPEDFLNQKCSNHTALYMADFTRFTRRLKKTKTKRKVSKRKK